MIAIVADSTAYLTHAEATAMGVTVVPMSYSIAGRSVYTEGHIDESGAYERLIIQNPNTLRTSQVTMATFMSAFDDLRSVDSEVLCITISSRLSGTYGNAIIAAREMGEQGITVVDSLTTGAGLYLMIREARAMIDQGLCLAEIATRLKSLRGRVRTVFSVEDMGPLRRSGRLGNVRLSISTILNIRPMLKCAEGSIVASGVVRGRHEQNRTLIASVTPHEGPLILEHFAADEQALAVADQLKLLGESMMIRQLGPVLSIHLGRGTLGIAWIEKE